jgi:hypothetical protein
MARTKAKTVVKKKGGSRKSRASRSNFPEGNLNRLEPDNPLYIASTRGKVAKRYGALLPRYYRIYDTQLMQFETHDPQRHQGLQKLEESRLHRYVRLKVFTSLYTHMYT